MTVMINLLPDTRQAKQRVVRRRQLMMSVSVAIWVTCGTVLVLMVLYSVSQKLIINDTTKRIASKEEQFRAVPNILDAMTAQQHLEALPELYGRRVYLTAFFKALQQADPTDVTVQSLTVDEQNALAVTGTGRDYAAVAKLARALEGSNVTVGTGSSPSNSPYFTHVSITSTDMSGKTGVNFTLNATIGTGVLHGK